MDKDVAAWIERQDWPGHVKANTRYACEARAALDLPVFTRNEWREWARVYRVGLMEVVDPPPVAV